MRYQCDHCGAKKYWKLGNSEYRCRGCRRDTKPRPVGSMKLRPSEWIRLIDLYLIGANSPTLAEKLNRSVPVVAKALRTLRACMAYDVPEIFSGTVEVDETYLGGQWKNKRKGVKALEDPASAGEARPSNQYSAF